MSVTVGTLIIDLKANTASFSGEMGKMAQLSAKSANDIKRSLEKITVAGAAMVASLVTGTAAVVRSALDQVDALGKAAQAAGTTAETLSVLQYAAKLSNVENEQLTKGLEKLSLAAFKAQGGNVQLQNIFKRLGISVVDANGHLKDSGILMEQLAVKFAAMGDGAGKTALAQALIGKAGAGLIPFLNQFGEEQAQINDEAHRFGLVLSQSTVDVAIKAHDNLDRLGTVMKGLGFSVLSAVLPALDELLRKLITISQTADLRGLAEAFGSKVTTAVRALGDALEFAAKHAEALKIALGTIAGLQLAKIAIPIIADLANGGLEKATAGIGKFVIGFAGLSRLVGPLSQLAGWLRTEITFVGLLASEEGIASAAIYVLGGAISALGGPVGIAIAAIVGLTAAIYHFRDATFEVQGQTYELRDIWSGAWIQMKDAMAPVGRAFHDLVDMIKKLWSEVVSFISQNAIAKKVVDDVRGATDWIKSHIPSLIADSDIDALNRARAQRLAANKPPAPVTLPSVTKPAKPLPNTSGLGKPQKDPYGDEIDKLNLAIEAQQKYLSVIDGTPEVIQAATAAEKAHAVIVELNNKLHDEGRAKLTALQEATIQQKVAQEESLKSLVDYGRELVSQQHSTDVSIQQAKAMALANAQGDDAVRKASVDNAILALTYNKTAEQLAKMAPEIARLRDLLTAKSGADLFESTSRDIFALGQEMAAQDILRGAILGTIDAQRQAEIQAKTYALSQQIAAESDVQARLALEEKRDAIELEMRAQQQALDLAEARKVLGGPIDEFQRDSDNLGNLIDALASAQGGYLTYSQQVSAAAAQQDIFDKAIDQTVQSMVRFGNARDGVDAFFLDMQKQAKSTASIVYDAMHSAFDKISEQLSQLVTGGKTSFAKMFQDIGRQIVQSEIKKYMQEAIAKLAQAHPSLGGIFGPKATGAKIDGSTASNALWVRMASADGTELTNFGQPRTTNELTDQIGRNPKLATSAAQTVSQINQIAAHPPMDVKSALSDLPSFIKLLGGLSPQKSPFGESLGLPTGKGNELTDLIGGGTPKGTATSPIYVKDVGGGSSKGLGDLLGGSGGSGDNSDTGSGNSGGLFGGLFTGLGNIFGGSSANSGGSEGDSGGGGFASGLGSLLGLLTNLIPHAEGGPVMPSSAYLVGEKGPEILTGVSGQITSNANSMRALSSSAGPTIHYAIDARGTDPAATEMRVQRAIRAAHASAITTSIQGTAERMKRVPNRY